MTRHNWYIYCTVYIIDLNHPVTDPTPWYHDIVTPGLLRHARTTYGMAMRRALEAAGYDDIPKNGLYVIGGLALGAGDTPLAELIRDLRISKQSAGQLVDTLVTRGYLQRSVDGDDRRRLVVTLTERGRAAAQTQAAARQKIDAQLNARVGDADVGALRRSLAALIDIQRSGANPAPPSHRVKPHAVRDAERLQANEIKAFVPARDFELCKRFYGDLGFTIPWSSDDLAYLHAGNASFLLQKFYAKQHAENFMMHMLVDDVQAWWQHVQTTGLAERYGVRTEPPADRPWRIRDFVLFDPTGVLWRIGQNIDAPEAAST